MTTPTDPLPTKTNTQTKPARVPESSRKAVSEALAEIRSRWREWREKFHDLPVIALLLVGVRKVAAALKPDSQAAKTWLPLKRDGERLGRARALFVAAEAIGQLPVGMVKAERDALINNLGELVRTGTSLQKVRALRAMRFIASEDCIPHIEHGLRDSSSWVQANALHTLFRLNLRDRKARSLLLSFLFASFRRSCTFTMRDLNDFAGTPSPSAPAPAEPAGIFVLSRGLVRSLFRERGGFWLGLLVIFLWSSAGLINAVVYSVAYAAMVAALTAGMLGALLLGLLGTPSTARLIGIPRQDRRWGTIALQTILDYGTVLAAFVLLPSPINLWVIGAYTLLLLLTAFLNSNEPQLAEDLRGLLRGLLLGSASLAALSSYPIVLTGFSLATLQMLVSGLGLWRRAKTLVPLLGQTVVVIIAFPLLLAFSILVMVALVILVVAGFIAFWPLEVVLLEVWIVESIRIRLLQGRRAIFRDLDHYFRYMIWIARDPWYPLWVRVRAVQQLSDIALANQQLINQLMDLAEEDLPAQVKDAIYQVVDSAEKRLARGQEDTVGFELAGTACVEPPVSPGAILEPWLVAGLSLLLIALLPLAVQIVGIPSWSLAEVILLGICVIGWFCLLTGTVLGRWSPLLCHWGFVLGFGLIGVVVACPLHEEVAAVSRAWSFGVMGMFDWSSFWSVCFPIWFSIVGAVIGHILYLLRWDVPLAPDEKTTAAQEQRSQETTPKLPPRWGVFLTVAAAVAIIASLLQSVWLADWITLSREPLPRFSTGRTRDSIILEDLPQDNRMIRVALVEREGEDQRPALYDTFPVVGTQRPRWPFGYWWERKAFDEVLPAEVCKGEVWISAEPSVPQSWEGFPSGGLAITSTDVGRVVFRIRPEILSSVPSGRLSLVAILYHPRRSPTVREKVRPDKLKQQFERTAPNSRFLTETLSYVREVWGPTIPSWGKP